MEALLIEHLFKEYDDLKRKKKELATAKREYFNKQQHKRYMIGWTKKNPDYKRQQYIKNQDRLKRKAREYYQNHKEEGTIKTAKYRACKNNYKPTKEEYSKIRALYRECKLISSVTNIPHEIDHIIPLSKGGTHTISNLQILSKDANQRKYNKIL